MTDDTEMSAAPRRRGRPPKPKVTDAELRLLAQVEGRPLNAHEIADILGVSLSHAWHLACGLKRRGVVRVVATIKPQSGDLEILAYCRGVWSHPLWPSALEAVLQQDASVAAAARVTGNFDYRIRGFHQDEAAADAWFRRLLATPGVDGGEMQFSQTVFERPHYASALLGGANPPSVKARSRGRR